MCLAAVSCSVFVQTLSSVLDGPLPAAGGESGLGASAVTQVFPAESPRVSLRLNLVVLFIVPSLLDSSVFLLLTDARFQLVDEPSVSLSVDTSLNLDLIDLINCRDWL